MRTHHNRTEPGPGSTQGGKVLARYTFCRSCGTFWDGDAIEYTECIKCGSQNLKESDTDWLDVVDE